MKAVPATALAAVAILTAIGRADAPPPATSRRILYHDGDVVAVHAKVRFTTLLALPAQDDVIEVTCGDKENWAVNAHASLVSVKPAGPGSETNLHVITTRGRIYAFLLREISNTADAEADLTVYVDRENDAALLPAVQYVPIQQVDEFRQQAEIAREDARTSRDRAWTEADDRVAAFRSAYPLTLKFPYRFQADREPFLIHAIFHDDRATYIQAGAKELPALYELKDGRPNLITFDVRNGTYVVPKILDRGYLVIGSRRVEFERADAR
jgi:type IV secretion system protein VirB9